MFIEARGVGCPSQGQTDQGDWGQEGGLYCWVQQGGTEGCLDL